MQEHIEQLIREGIQADTVEVDMSGNHCTVVVVSGEFEGLNQVKRQQKVYQCLNDKIASGEIHAVNIRALTPEQWQAQQ